MPADPIQQLRLNAYQPAPLPTTYTVADVTIDAQRWVLIKIDQPNGSLVGWFDPDTAKRFADQLRMTAAGLSLVTNPPNNNNGG